MDNTKLVECLEYQKSIGNQSDSGFKSITWTYAASELNKVIIEGGEKTASGVKDHWQQVVCYHSINISLKLPDFYVL